MKKGIMITLIVAMIASLWWKIFIPDTSTKKRKVIPQVSTQHEEETIPTQINKFNKKYLVLYALDENISLHEVTRYTRKILVNLGLSRKELEENLIHAAWELQKEKKATAVMIFAYRMDDTQRELYTAGRCILAPFGDWAKATDKQSNSISNLKPVIDIAKVYFTNIPPMYKIKSSVVVNTDNTSLYKNKDLESENIIAKLKKGTEAIIVDSKRFFSTDDFMDIYKIRFPVRRGKTITGWVFGNNLDISQPGITSAQPTPEKNMTQYLKKRYETIYLYDKKISHWKRAKQEDKIIICEAFLLIALNGGKLKVSVVSMENVTDYAKILANTVDVVSSKSRNFDSVNVIEMIINTAKSIGWI